MKIYNSRRILFLVICVSLLFVGVSPARSDLGSIAMVSPQESLVASLIRNAAEVRTLFEEFNREMGHYEAQRLQCESSSNPADKAKCLENLNAVLDRARDILRRLHQQADSIESRVGVAGKDTSLDPRYLQKIDRVLASVKTMRTEADRRFQATNRSG